MKMDMHPCPYCEALPELSPTGVTLRQDGHEPVAEMIDISTRERSDYLCRLIFRCRRCGGRWPEQPERIVRA